jgi:hypothetical protein
MTDLMQKALAAVRQWRDEQQNEAAALLLAMDELGSSYHASPEELAAIDAALDDLARGKSASEAEVEAAFSRFRK